MRSSSAPAVAAAAAVSSPPGSTSVPQSPRVNAKRCQREPASHVARTAPVGYEAKARGLTRSR